MTQKPFMLAESSIRCYKSRHPTSHIHLENASKQQPKCRYLCLDTYENGYQVTRRAPRMTFGVHL